MVPSVDVLAETQPDTKNSLLRRVAPWIGRIGAIPAALGVWYLAFDYFPASWYSDDEISKYVAVAALAVAAGSIVWAAGAELNRSLLKRRIVENESNTAPVSWNPPEADLRSTARRLSDSLVRLGVDVGWCHYLGSFGQAQSPSALSSAFALRTFMLTTNDAPGVPVHEVCEWIRSRANDDGGWSAQTQGTISRPEVTAIVAGTLARLEGPGEVLERAVESIEHAMQPGVDPVATTNTYVVATILEEDPFLRLSTNTTAALLQSLLNGAIPVGGDQYCWAEQLPRHQRESPSAALTARAVLAIQALVKVGYVPTAAAAPILQGALRWMATAQMANESTSVVRMATPGRQELNAPRHFTAALIAQCLWQAGLGSSDTARQALATSWESHDDGLWYWHSGDAPTYMTYYGLSAVLTGRMRWNG